ncbi:MAG: serine/threonine-protein kinase, partial [Myxococcota bacterium]
MDKSADASRVPEDATTHVRSVANEIAGAPSEHQLRQVKELRPRDPAAANRLLAKLEGALLDGPVDAGVARYVPLEKIGAGGLGTVYAAYDPELDRKVAVKFVRTDPEGVNARARLVREAQAMAQLNHPNVAAVHDVGTVGNEVFIAMELVDGVTLSGWWRAEKRSWKQVRDMMLQAGRGLSAAHAAGLVHRDFKPPNVLVGTDGRVRVLDFGLARTWHNDVPAPRFVPAAGKGVDANLTDSRLLLGTPAYMAPEQITGGSVGPAADQFAFCATLFEGIHGARPFQGDDVSKLMQSVIDGRVTRPTSPARIPAWLHKTIKRGMSTDPAQRFPSMDALLFALEHDRRSRRKQWFVAATVAVVSIVAALLGVFLLRPVPTEEDRAWVAALAAEAREAAEKGRYLYPPPDSPDIETAYQWVRKLERVEGSGSSIARTAADDLRSDLASDLLALGDQYWDRDGGRAFASDYYGMALVFDPDVDRRARARSAQTPGEAADIKARADEG